MINNFEDYIEAKDLEEQDDSQTLEDYSAYELLQYIFQDCYFFFNEFRAIKTEGNKDVIQTFHSILLTLIWTQYLLTTQTTLL